MDLAELKFVVVTKDLETATDKIKALQAAVVSLNETQKSSLAVAKDDASAQQIRIKSTIEMTKLKGQLAQAEANAQEATDRSTKSNNALGDSSDAVTKRLSKQADVLKLTRGQTIEVADGNLTLDRSFRQSQVSALANLKALGATTEQMQMFAGTFKELNTAAGFNPLDKMSSGLTQLTQEVKELSSVSKLMESNVNLSRGALVSLSRDVEATTAAMKAEGKTTQDIDGAIASLTNQYKTLSSQKEVFISQSNDAAAAAKREAQALLNIGKDDKRDQAQQLRETAKASSALEKELKRVDFVLTDVNANLQLSNSNRLLKFQDNLAKSGVTGAEATKQLEAYRGKLELIQKNNAFQKQTLDATEYQKRVSYITRAVGPQLTDIFSGLATGQQSLYTIAIQQGGQLADQFSLAGIEASKMGGILANALPNMAKNISSIGIAFGQMAVSGLKSLGTSFIDMGLSVFGAGKQLSSFRNEMIAMDGLIGGTSDRVRLFDKIISGIGIAAGLSIAALAGVFIALGVAIFQVAQEEKKLSIALNLTGASLGFNKDAAVQYAKSISDATVSTTNIVDAITEMAKVGGFGAESIKMISVSANEMQKATGASISDTVKQFQEMKDKPVESLTKLAEATGLISPEVLKLVNNLVEQGRFAEAAAISMETLADVNSIVAARIIKDLNPLEAAYKKVAGGISDMMESFRDAVRFDPAAETEKKLRIAYSNLEFFSRSPDTRAKEIEEQKVIISQISAEIRLQGERTKNLKAYSEAAKDFAANNKLEKPLDDKLAGFSKKELPQQEFINNAISKYVKELDGAAVSLDVLNKVKAVAAEEWKRAQTKPKESDEQKKLNKATEEYIDIQNKANGVSNSFNNEIEGQQLLLKHNRISLEQYISVVLDLIKTQKFSTDAAAATEKVRKETLQTQKAFLKVEEDIQKVRDEATKENLALNLRNELLGKTEEEQLKINRAYETANKLREIQIKLDEDLTKIKNDQNLQKDPMLGFILQTQTINAYGKQVEAVNAGIATQAAEDMQKSFDSIKSILKDSIMSALFEGGESGGKKLREAIVDAFRNKITIVVDAVVNTIMGTALSAFKSLMTGSGDSSTGMDSLISGGKSIYNAISGGFDKLSVSSQFGNFATSSIGQSIGLSSMQNTYDAYGGIGQSVQLTDTANSLSKTLGTASNVLGYANSAFKLSQGKIGEAAGSAIGQYFGGPLGNMIGSKLGAMVDKAFSGETRNGATYTTGADGRAVLQQGPSGGEIAGSDARRMFETTQAAIVDTLKAVGSKATLSGFVAGLESSSNGKGFQFAGGMVNGRGFGESGGRDGGQFSFTSQDSKTAFENYGMQLSQSIVEALQATDDLPVTINKIIKEALGGNAVASLTSDAVNALLTTINAVVQTVNTFNAAVLTLPFENIKNLSFDAAAGLIAAAGGISNLTTNLSTFYDNFYSDEEKRLQVIKNINATTAGSTLDAATATRESFRKLVEAQDLSTEAGQRTYASLIAVSGAFAGITPVLDKVTDAIDNVKIAQELLDKALQLTKDNTNDAYAALERAVAAEKSRIDATIESTKVQVDALKDQQTIAQQSVNLLNDLFEALKTNVKELYLQVDSTSVQQVQNARNIITSAAAGNVPENKVLLDAISTVRGSLNTNLYENKISQDRDRLLLANELSSIGNNTQEQLTTGEIQVRALKEQIFNQERIIDSLNLEKSSLDDILTSSKMQIDALNGINTSVISLQNAISLLAIAMSSQSSAQARVSPGVKAPASTSDSMQNTTTALSFYNNFPVDISSNANAEGLAYWANAIAVQGEATAKSNFALAASGILGITTPSVNAFAKGGNYPGGMALVGEQGPELINFDKPGQVYTASQSANMMSNDSGLIDAFDKLSTQFEMLRIETRAIVTNTSKINKSVERVLVPTNQGDALQIKAVT
jgi:phage-related minor tail protein